MAQGTEGVDIVQSHFEDVSLENLPQTAKESLHGVIQEFDRYERIIRRQQAEIEALKEENARLNHEISILKNETQGKDLVDGHFGEDSDMPGDGHPSASSFKRPSAPESVSGCQPFSTFSSVGSGKGADLADTELPIGSSSHGMEQYIKQEIEDALQPPSSLKLSSPPGNTTGVTDDPPDSSPVETLKHEHIQFMVDELEVSVWQQYMRALGLIEKELDTIRYDHRDDGVKEQIYQAFCKWQDKAGAKACPEKLIKVALKRKLRRLAETFCRKFPEYAHVLESETEKRQSRKIAAKGKELLHSQSASGLSSMDRRPEEPSHYQQAGGYHQGSDVLSPEKGGSLVHSMSDMNLSSTHSHGGGHSSFASQQNEAVPNYQSYEPTPSAAGAVAFPSSSSDSSFFISILQPYMKDRSQADILFLEMKSYPCVLQNRTLFHMYLQKHQTEVIFQKEFQQKIDELDNWIHIGDHWAGCIITAGIITEKRPPTFLWNFMLALQLSRMDSLYTKIKKYLLPGSAGPSIPHENFVSDAAWDFLNTITKRLDVLVPGAGDWRQMADSLGYSQDIPLWAQKSSGAKNVIELYKTTGKTIQDLYESFYKMKRYDMLNSMEDPQYLKPYFVTFQMK